MKDNDLDNHYSLKEGTGEKNDNNDNNDNNKKSPKIFTFFKIIAFALIAVGIGLIIYSYTLDIPSMSAPNWFDESTNQMHIKSAGYSCLMFGFFTLFVAFIPQILKGFLHVQKNFMESNKKTLEDLGATAGGISARATKRVMNENEEDIKEILNKGAEYIASGAQKVKRNSDINKIYCKHCGASIDADSTFCNHCGQKLK